MRGGKGKGDGEGERQKGSVLRGESWAGNVA